MHIHVHVNVDVLSSKKFFLCVFSHGYVQAQVLYDFSAEPGNNELTVKEGETITITNQVKMY